MAAAWTPRLSVNGAPPVPIAHGTTTIDLPAGTYDLGIAVHCDEIAVSTYGQASIRVTVLPGGTTVVHYNAPHVALGKGRIGLTPQPRLLVRLGPILFWRLAVPLAAVALMIVLLVALG